MKNLITKIVAPVVLVASLLMPSKATADDMNPYHQPNQTTLYYGSGDVDGDGNKDWEDYNLILSGTQNDMADVNGNGTPGEPEDAEIFGQFLNGERNYLPSDWNSLQTVAERDDWTSRMLDIDETSEIPYQDGEFISGDYRTVTEMNFAGRIDPNNPNIPYDPNIINFARFNLPMYGVAIYNPNTGWGHGANAIFTGENTLNFNDWSFVEPQLDDINVQPGSQSIPRNTYVFIDILGGFQENGNRTSIPLVGFQIDNDGNPSLYESANYPNPDLITTRPTVDIKETVETPNQYILGNYPNPFNSSTTINYSLPFTEKVELNVYDIRGRKLETLVNGIQHKGEHSVNMDFSKYSSGTYIYRLSSENGFSKAGKMTLVK